jgi:hypothetical protein
MLQAYLDFRKWTTSINGLEYGILQFDYICTTLGFHRVDDATFFAPVNDGHMVP